MFFNDYYRHEKDEPVLWTQSPITDTKDTAVTSTDQRINAAAVRLFTEKGATQVTISELANEARVARGTLYRNIDSIEQIFDKVVAAFNAEMHEESRGPSSTSTTRLCDWPTEFGYGCATPTRTRRWAGSPCGSR